MCTDVVCSQVYNADPDDGKQVKLAQSLKHFYALILFLSNMSSSDEGT